MEKRFGVAVLGAGNRARYVVKNLLRDSGGAVRVVSAFDPDRTLLDETLRKIWGSSDALAASSAEEAIHAPGVDWVMVFSPNSCHRDHILAAFAAGNHELEFGPMRDRYIDQLEEFAACVRGEKINPYSFEHESLVQKTVLAVSGYTKWENHSAAAGCSETETVFPQKSKCKI